MWPLVRAADGTITTGGSPFTAVAHSGEVNCVDVSPRSKGGGFLVATGGADKRAVLWFVEHLSASKQSVKELCKLSGHKRGIWDVRFSSVAKMLATASGDSTVRLWRWGGGTATCVRVLQGHSGAVLRVAWITLGTQVVSAGSDGLLKVWSTTDSECQATLDSATPVLPEPRPNAAAAAATTTAADDDDIDERLIGKVWALEAKLDGALLVSGDSNGQLCVWRDRTLEAVQEDLAAKQQRASLKQDMDNHIKGGRYAPALVLALQLDHRAQAKSIVELIRASGEEDALRHLVAHELDEASLALLVRLCTEWNKNSSHCVAAHAVMNAVLKALPADTKLCTMIAPSSDAWLSFSERHERRLTGLLVSSYVLDHCLETIGGDISVDVPAEVVRADPDAEDREERRKKRA